MITIPTWAVVLIVVGLCLFIGYVKGWGWLMFIGLCIAVVSGVVACGNSECSQKHRAAEAEQAKRDATPHVIREADGCKVYAWKGGDWHYFTRCSATDTVTTERHYTVSCGHKNQQRCDRKETIVTEPEK